MYTHVLKKECDELSQMKKELKMKNVAVECWNTSLLKKLTPVDYSHMAKAREGGPKDTKELSQFLTS